MRIVLAVADADERSALRLVLSQEPDLEVVAEASDTHGLLARIQGTEPDLVLLDWEIPGHPAADLMDSLRRCKLGTSIIVLSLRPQAEAVALSAGADGFVYKADPPREMLTQVRKWASSEAGTATQ